MSTDLATMPENGLVLQQTARIDYQTLEKLVAQGDLKGLTAPQRVSYYQARCVACGLDPASQPFEYITFQGKLILYAKKTATDQLTRLHRISLSKVGSEFDLDSGIFEVTYRATFPDGRVGEDVGTMFIGTLKGEALAIARMKTVTKAKRRTILAACGLGMLDETEVEDVESHGGAGFTPYGQVEAHAEPPKKPSKTNQHPNNSGHGFGQYASDEQVKKYLDWLKSVLNGTEKQPGGANGQWADFWQDRDTGEWPDVPACKNEFMSIYQADAHLVKWLVTTTQIDQDALDKNGKASMLGKHAAIVVHRSNDEARALKAELLAYIARTFEDKKLAIYRSHPELAPEEIGEEDDSMAENGEGNE